MIMIMIRFSETETLILKAKDGDRKAFDELTELYIKKAFAVAFRLELNVAAPSTLSVPSISTLFVTHRSSTVSLPSSVFKVMVI